MNKLSLQPRHWAVFTALFFVLLAGCASLGMPKPNSPSQVVYSSYGLYVSVVDTTAQLLDADVISVEQAELVQKQSLPLRADIDKAKALTDVGLPVGDTLMEKVQSSQMLLLRLQRYLEEQK